MNKETQSAFVRAAQNDTCQAAQQEGCGCPMPKDDAVNEANMMPNTSNQPTEGQQYPLNMNRKLSSIPVSSDSSLPVHQEKGAKTWIYPSEQMFYNAMKRKGYHPVESDMQQVVMIHNLVNERCWYEIMYWEAMHCDKCPSPTLKRFRGRAKDYSLRARWLQLWGYKLPFDRHDWIVDRCGEEVRYIIDFYSGLSDAKAPVSMYLDTRPALDSVGAVWDRVIMTWKQFLGEEETKEGVLRVRQMQNYNVANSEQSQ
eukprot:TRINITY_DN3724_c0_g1_i1.p1 TRINITY_DN3724_c0_g1~~TRINITY_DN3724_c0_g1_i1.p1  ORF type:complete len:278 (-),score=28.07 TRINITY_DN3724_c0_g1_i1:884-1651(-)